MGVLVLSVEDGDLREHLPPFSVLGVPESRVVRVEAATVVKNPLEIVQVGHHPREPGHVPIRLSVPIGFTTPIFWEQSQYID